MLHQSLPEANSFYLLFRFLNASFLELMCTGKSGHEILLTRIFRKKSIVDMLNC